MPSFEDFAQQIKTEFRPVFEAVNELPDIANVVFKTAVDDTKHKVLRALAMIVVNDFQALTVLAVNGFGLQAGGEDCTDDVRNLCDLPEFFGPIATGERR